MAYELKRVATDNPGMAFEFGRIFQILNMLIGKEEQLKIESQAQE